MKIRTKRVYEPAKRSDGVRVLIDRIWPRGVSKKEAAIDLWLKDVAPSTALRKWFGHEPARWKKFRIKYRSELAKQRDALAELKKIGRGKTVTLVYAAHDTDHNNAVALAEYLSRRKPRKARANPK